MATTIAVLLHKRRSALRKAGLRPVRIRMPDTRRPGFAAEYQRQCELVSQADLADADLLVFMDAALAALADVDGWIA